VTDLVPTSRVVETLLINKPEADSIKDLTRGVDSINGFNYCLDGREVIVFGYL